MSGLPTYRISEPCHCIRYRNYPYTKNDRYRYQVPYSTEGFEYILCHQVRYRYLTVTGGPVPVYTCRQISSRTCISIYF